MTHLSRGIAFGFSGLLGLVLALPMSGEAAPKAAPRAQAVSTTQRDPQAVALVNAAVAALDNATAVSDTTLQATTNYTAGSDAESGTATLEGKVGNESKVVLSLAGGQRQEIRSGQAGAWIGPDGQKHPMALHNLWTDAAWFFPGLNLQAALSDPNVGMTYVGPETLGTAAVQHVRLFRVVPGQLADVTALIQALSTTNLYLDATSSLPVAVDFNLHPDADASSNIPVEIDFNNYQLTNGVVAPWHVQKLLEGTLLLDITVSAVTINSGIPDSEFTF